MNLHGCLSDEEYHDFEDMLFDDDRNSKYRKAIVRAVEQKLRDEGEAHVLDIGSGSGLLSLFAVSAGATTVTAVEIDSRIFEISKKVAKAGFFEKITFINLDSNQLDNLPIKANVLVSEIFDSELLGEGVLGTFRHALQHLTTDTVTCVPAEARLVAIPVQCDILGQHSRLPHPLRTECYANLRALDGQWSVLRRGDQIFFASEPVTAMSFKFNDLSSINLSDTDRLNIEITKDVDRLDGVLVYWELDLSGDGEDVISTEPHNSEFRTHWLPLLYGFVEPVFVRMDELIRLYISHDQFSFWFQIEFDAKLEWSRDILPRAPCTCEWHDIISPATIFRWNMYESSEFVEMAVSTALDKTVVCLGSHSLLSVYLAKTAHKVILIEEDTRFKRKIAEDLSKFCTGNVEMFSKIEEIPDWDEIDLVIFDILSDNTVSPTEFARPYMQIVQNHGSIPLLPQVFELKATFVKFRCAAKRTDQLERIYEFDYSDFWRFSRRASGTKRDDQLEILPLWEYNNSALSTRTVLAFHEPDLLPNREEWQIGTDMDALVFWPFYEHLSTVLHPALRFANDGKLKWAPGFKHGIYFRHSQTSKRLHMDFQLKGDQLTFRVWDI